MGGQKGTQSISQLFHAAGVAWQWQPAVALSAPVGPLVQLPEDVCEHKVGEVRALLDVRQREVLQEVVQELDEADDLIIDLCARLHTCPDTKVRCHALVCGEVS